jgi:hypothetical protein
MDRNIIACDTIRDKCFSRYVNTEESKEDITPPMLAVNNTERKKDDIFCH